MDEENKSDIKSAINCLINVRKLFAEEDRFVIDDAINLLDNLLNDMDEDL